VRVQLTPAVNRPRPQVLHILCSAGMCLIDTCSDVTLAWRDVLRSIQRAETAVVIAHLGGETNLQDFGSLDLEPGRNGTVTICNAFAVEAGDLPAGVVALIGVSDVLHLGLSLDRIAEHPSYSLQEARPLGVMGRLFACLGGVYSRVSRLVLSRAPQGGNLPVAPPEQTELSGRVEAHLRPEIPLPDPRPPSSPRSNFLQSFRPTLEELKALHWQQQQARTRARIDRLFSAPPPARAKKLPHPRSPSLAHMSSSSANPPINRTPRSQSLEALEPLMPRRGKSKFYGVRVGRQIGVFNSWEKCRLMVDGVSNSEFRSFHSYTEAVDWINTGWRSRRINITNLSPKLEPMSFIGELSAPCCTFSKKGKPKRMYEYIFLVHNLLGIAPFADKECTATFSANRFALYHLDRKSILVGTRHTGNLWRIALSNYHYPIAPSAPILPLETGPVLLLHQTQQQPDREHVRFVHAALGSPPPTTFMKAVTCGYINGPRQFPRLTTKMVRQNMPNSEATSRGHLRKSPTAQPHAHSDAVSARQRQHKTAVLQEMLK
jgi:hypothetical protein